MNDNVVQLNQQGGSLTIDRPDMVRWMKDLRDSRETLKEEEERGKEYLAQCRAEVEQDLEPRRKAIEKLEEMIAIYLKEENGGEKYKVPGIGTVFLTHRTTPKIVDEDVLGETIKEWNPLAYETMTSVKLDRKKAQAFANKFLKGDGLIMPGIEVTETESLSLRQ